MGSWPIILPVFAIGFVCGALWMRARCRYMATRRIALLENVADLAVAKNCADDWRRSTTAYAFAGGSREVLTGRRNRGTTSPSAGAARKHLGVIDASRPSFERGS